MDDVFRGPGDKDFSRSPLQHLLESNATPSDSEVITIRTLITNAEASIEKLHRRFPTRYRASQVSKLLKTIEAHRALLSPVRYLPSEILQEVFLYYVDKQDPNDATIRTMPWRLGHITHRWREVALSLPSLWDDIPKIYLFETGLEQSFVQALICLLRRTGTSRTLKLNIGQYQGFGSLRMGYESPTSIIEKIMLHSERIEQLCIEVNSTTMPLLQGFKGRLPNLRILRVLYYVPAPNLNIDVFETAPALRQVSLGGLCHNSSVNVLLPWSQITHFEDERIRRVGRLVLLSSSSLCSLTSLDIYRPLCLYRVDKSPLSPYRPTTLPNLRTLSVVIYDRDYKDVDLFLESLTVPAVEVMKIRHMRPLIPPLLSMFSGSRGPSRLQKLAFRTIPLQAGELSALLKLTPHLVELDIDVPPAADLLRLTYSEGEVMLVPMLQALYMRIPHVLATAAQIEYLDTIAKVRCELGICKDSEDTAMLSPRPGTWTTLRTLRVFFDTAESRDSSQKILNNWSSSFTTEEANAIDRIRQWWRRDISAESFVKNVLPVSSIERYEITNKVLHVGVSFWMVACGIFTLILFYFIFIRRQIYSLSYNNIISLRS